jgi:hypothetical protein
MGENIQQRTGKTRTEAHTAEPIARKLLDVIVYDKGCHIGDKLTLGALIETTDIGDWKMSVFETARTYAAAQGWLVVEGESMRLTTAGAAAA